MPPPMRTRTPTSTPAPTPTTTTTTTTTSTPMARLPPGLLPYWRGLIAFAVCLTILLVCLAASSDIERSRKSVLQANQRALASTAALLAGHAAQMLRGADADADVGVGVGAGAGAGAGVDAARVPTVDVAALQRFYATARLAPGTVVELLRADGQPLLRFESGGPVPGGLAGGRMALAVHDVDGFPLRIRVSDPQAMVLADWRTTSIQIITRSVAILAFVVLLSFALVAQVRRREDASARLHSSDQLWQPVFDNTPVGIAVLPPGGHFISANPAFQRLLGYSMAALSRLTTRDISHEDDFRELELATDELLRGRSASVRRTQRFRHRDGHLVWTEISVARVSAARQSANWHLDGVLIVTVEDITARRQAEQERNERELQTRQAQKMEALGTFAGGIAHDFNNILGAILGYGERALDTLPALGPGRSHVEQVMQAGHRARLLVQRILAFSRSEHRARLPFRLAPVVDETLDLVRARLPAAVALELALAPAARAAVLSGDATDLHQVLMNLCSNAILAMPDGGTLRVALAIADIGENEERTLSHGALRRGRHVLLSVGDSGVGMAPALLESIFNPFFTTRVAGQGTGLGLALVDGIVRDYAGALHVDTAPGRGTRFDVYLPVSPPMPQPVFEHEHEHEQSGAPSQGRGQTVLLVDDDTALLLHNEEILATLGYEAVGFHSGDAAWAAFLDEPQRFDALLTDQNMPGLTGLDLCARMRGLRPGLPLLLCSGEMNPALELLALAAGVTQVLHKPLLAQDLARALRESGL